MCAACQPVAQPTPTRAQLGLIENQADYIEPAVRGVRDAGTPIALLVVPVIWLFLGSWRQVTVMLLVMPVTLVASFAWIHLLAGQRLE